MSTYAPSDHAFIARVLTIDTEVVLAELLAAFNFEEAGKPISWNIGEAIYPTIGVGSTRPEFPMKVTVLKSPSATN